MTLLAALLLSVTFTRPLERVTSLDPAKAQSVYDSSVIQLLYRTPLEIDYVKRPYKLVDGLCKVPKVSEDGLTYVFKMADGALPITAYDVARNLNRLRDPAMAFPGAWTMKGVEDIRVLDNDTFEIKLRERMFIFPWMMAMSSSAIQLQDGSGTGPFILESWTKNHEMVFRRRKDIEGYFNYVRYLIVNDASTQWLMFLSGELDLLADISRDNWDAIVDSNGELLPQIAAKGARLYSVPSLEIFYIGFNLSDPVIGKNKKLRQALSCAFDFNSWREFNNKRIDNANSPVPYGVEGRMNEAHPYSYNLERAKKLLAEAGYENGIDPTTGRRLQLELSLGRATQESRETGELLASFFARIGVKLELSFNTWSAFLRAVNEGRVQMYLMGWIGDYPDAENFLQLFHSKNKSPGPNHSNYESKEFDETFDKAMQASSAKERNELWKRCQEIVAEDCPWIYLHYPKKYTLMREEIENYIPGNFPYGQEQYFKKKVQKK